MNSENYIGVDVHQATISVAVMDSMGKLIMESILETKAATILEFVAGLRGTLSVTFEEGTWAAWLYDLLKPHVTNWWCCNPRKSALLKDGNKSDRIDARKLADRLRLNDLKPVYHSETGVRMLRELARSYLNLVKDQTRVPVREGEVFSFDIPFIDRRHFRSDRVGRIPLGLLGGRDSPYEGGTVERSPGALDRFKNIVFRTAFKTRNDRTFRCCIIPSECVEFHHGLPGAGDPEAPVVLFLHGNPTSSYIWQKILPLVAPVAYCIAPDVIGFGQSGKPDIEYRFADHVRYLDAFFDRARISSAFVVAQDWGSGLAFHLAARRPEFIRGVAFMEFVHPAHAFMERFSCGRNRNLPEVQDSRRRRKR